MRQVAVIKRDEVRLEERVAEAPAEQCPAARWVCRDEVIRDAGRSIAVLVLRDKVARVDGEHLPADHEGESVGRCAGERGLSVGVFGECR